MTRRNTLADDAARFREMHKAEKMLLLPNAWDSSSAAALAEAGFLAIGTSSGAIARSLGQSDGERLSKETMFGVVERIVHGATEGSAEAAPGTVVSADIESGYGLDPDGLVAALADAGAVGCNLEDSDPHSGEMKGVDEQVAFISSVAAAAKAAGTGLVINARVDLHVRRHGDELTRLPRAIERANAYLEAGADCVFPIMLTDDEQVDQFVSAVRGPVNIMYVAKAPPLKRLAEIGVARVSFGSGIHRASLAAVSAVAARIAALEHPYT